jgi:Tfp pilus assembly protein PilE
MTLVELMVVITLTGILAVLAIPSYRRGMEQSRADHAAATLRTVWAAQRLYKIDNPTYAGDLATLSADNLIDASIPGQTSPYVYQITAASSAGFVMTATRSGSQVWSGTLTIDETGAVTGVVTSPDGTIYPSSAFKE